MANYFISVRNTITKNGKKEFGNEPGEVNYLIVPDDASDIHPSDRSSNENDWLKKLLAGRELEEVLIYVHGYNMDRDITVERHKILKKGLLEKGWKGELITFAWPSKEHTALYWEDRFDALEVCTKLVTSAIRLLDEQISKGCNLKVHVLAHSTGALIVRESFRLAPIGIWEPESSWAVGQMIFIAGDISSESMVGDQSESLYKHCGRITNYFSNYDSALMVSGVKRLGFANRVGRVGLPIDSSNKSIDVNCSQYFQAHKDELETKVVNAAFSHAWYFWGDKFLEDLCYTLDGSLDRNVIPTREKDSMGEFWLKV